MSAVCGCCPHACALEEGQVGLCRTRGCVGGEVKCLSYGRVSSVALDPIEKKPLRRFHPGGRILSVGGFGCNMRCPYCQNHEISMNQAPKDAPYVPPEALARRAAEIRGNIGVAYTYNEPLVDWEYVRDCAALVREAGLLNVLVTNGMAADAVMDALFPFIDAMNIDLKSFSEETYASLGGDLKAVKRFILRAARSCHVEITALIVPGKSDSEAEMDARCAFLAAIDPEIPLHITRYFPRYRVGGAPTPIDTIVRLTGIARRRLKYVYPGNI